MKPEINAAQPAWNLFCKGGVPEAKRAPAAAMHKLQAACAYIVSYFNLVCPLI